MAQSFENRYPYKIENVGTNIIQLCSNPIAPKKQLDLERGIKGPGGCLCAGQNCYLAAFLEMSHLKPEDILLFDITDEVSVYLFI